MKDLINLISTLSQKQQSTKNETSQTIPKEILDQYPYGQFPIQYTRPGQEIIRKNSENRFSYNEEKNIEEKYNESNFDINAMLPIIEILYNKKQSPQDIFQVFSKLLFKDNPELENLMSLFSKSSKQNITSQSINNTSNFPNTNKVCIANLKKVEK